MNKRLAIFISVLALAMVAVLPWLWRWSPALAWLCALAISVWCVWLMVLYLKWAPTLGQRSPDEPTLSEPTPDTGRTNDGR